MNGIRGAQQGATLITVLAILVVMTLIGALAIRQGVQSLGIVTNSQARSLLTQTADSVFFAIEKDNKDSGTLQKNMSALGLFGMVKSNTYVNQELVLCYRPKRRQDLFVLRDSSTVSWNSDGTINNDDLGSKGFCQLTDMDYSSNRAAVITQIAVKKGALGTSVPFKLYQVGTDSSTVQLQEVQPVKVIVTSIIPGAAVETTLPSGTSFTDAVNGCFKNYTNDTTEAFPDKDTVADCFVKLGVPYSRQIMDYAIVNYVTKS